jgi:hypothetical protein
VHSIRWNAKRTVLIDRLAGLEPLARNREALHDLIMLLGFRAAARVRADRIFGGRPQH